MAVGLCVPLHLRRKGAGQEVDLCPVATLASWTTPDLVNTITGVMETPAGSTVTLDNILHPDLTKRTFDIALDLLTEAIAPLTKIVYEAVAVLTEIITTGKTPGPGRTKLTTIQVIKVIKIVCL